MMLLGLFAALKNYFSGVYLDKELEEFLKSKGTLTPEQEDRHRKQFLNTKIRGRYY